MSINIPSIASNPAAQRKSPAGEGGARPGIIY
jgi:hypothetical protein